MSQRKPAWIPLFDARHPERKCPTTDLLASAVGRLRICRKNALLYLNESVSSFISICGLMRS